MKTFIEDLLIIKELILKKLVNVEENPALRRFLNNVRSIEHHLTAAVFNDINKVLNQMALHGK